MSDKPKIPLSLAKEIAEEWMDAIRPHCDMVGVGMGLRQEEPEIDSIFILFGAEDQNVRDNNRVIALLQKANQKDIALDYIGYSCSSLKLPVSGTEIPIWFWQAKPRLWGFDMARWSGNREFADYLLFCIMHRFGFSDTSKVWRTPGINIPDEATCFRLCGLPDDVPMYVRSAWTAYSTPETFGLKRRR